MLATLLVAGERAARAQVDYVARFTFEKPAYRVGEPVFCTFTIRNTGTRPFAFSYRSPWRALGSNLPKEPRFRVADAKGRRLPDPAPKPCGGAKEGVVYGFVSLPPGGTQRERWLLNQWARLSEPGRYFVRAERRLPLLGFDPVTEGLSKKPLAFALAINELSFELKPATEDELQPLLEPYLKAFDDPARGTSDLSEPVLVATALPKPYFLDRLVRLARPSPDEHRWDARRGLEGLARLGTAPAWAAILEIARGGERNGAADDPALRGYAILLLGEKGDPGFVAPLLSMLPGASEEIRGDILRALGFFHSPRANQALFERLHSSEPSDRVNQRCRPGAHRYGDRPGARSAPGGEFRASEPDRGQHHAFGEDRRSRRRACLRPVARLVAGTHRDLHPAPRRALPRLVAAGGALASK